MGHQEEGERGGEGGEGERGQVRNQVLLTIEKEKTEARCIW